MPTLFPKSPRRRPARACLALLTLLLGAAPAAQAVFVFSGLGSPRSVTLRVGSANASINTVTFNVSNAAVSPNNLPVTGIPGGGAPATTVTNGVDIQVTTVMPGSLLGTNTLRLTVDSTAGLSCVGGTGCGTTVIPFSNVRWTSYNKAPGGGDLGDGTFDGTATQTLVNYAQYTGLLGGESVSMSNVVVFEYINSSLFPSGQYTGRVVYTASNL